MILSRAVKWRIAVLSAATIIAALVLGVVYLRVPEAMGLGRYAVTARFERGAGLYDGSEVTYLGHPIGKVTHMRIADRGIAVTMSLEEAVNVPGTVAAEIHSRSAVGEQYVDLVAAGGPAEVGLLRDGDTIAMANTSAPVEMGPLLDHVGALADSLPADDLNVLLRESSSALRGRQADLAGIIDHGASFLGAARQHLPATRRLLTDFHPFSRSITSSSQQISRLTRNLARVTSTLRASDSDIRALLARGPGLSRETRFLLADLGPVLPPLLRNADTNAEILATYNDGLAQILSVYPRVVEFVQSITLPHRQDHQIAVDLATDVEDPCVDGFIPPEQWRGPADQSLAETPPVFCNIPSGDHRVTKGARKIPCVRYPGLTGATPAICRREATMPDG